MDEGDTFSERCNQRIQRHKGFKQRQQNKIVRHSRRDCHAQGPIVIAPTKAGKSERSILANEGESGTGNSRKDKIKDTAASSEIMVMVRVLRREAAFLPVTAVTEID